LYTLEIYKIKFILNDFDILYPVALSFLLHDLLIVVYSLLWTQSETLFASETSNRTALTPRPSLPKMLQFLEFF